MDEGRIHDEHPFIAPPEQRDPVRRLRGRMAAPVTIVTAGDDGSEDGRRTGLTVSSLVVAEGDPPLVYCLLGTTTDLMGVIAATGRFVVHVCETRHREVADVFAGLRPNPGGLFAGHPTTQIGHGPLLAGFDTYALCTYVADREESYSVLLSGTVDEVVVGDLGDPLVYFRGAYRRLG